MADQAPPDPQRTPKSSSERGRAFREREREHVEQLETDIAGLQHQIADQTFLRGVWQAKCQRSRHARHGVLKRLVEEYYSVVRLGVRDTHATRRGSRATRTHRTSREDPVEFLWRVTHRDAVLGDVVGPQGMVDQWKKYTSAHGMYESRIRDIEVQGPEEDPFVSAQLETRVRVTRKTFEILFPHMTDDESLIQQLIGREITYRGSTLLRFSSDNQIVFQQLHLGFGEALVDAGIAIEDVERLMRGSRISPACTILEAREEPVAEAVGDRVAHEWKF